MPYSGISDSNLPTSVKKLPKALRELWVRVFNENHDEQDEATAFKVAWSVIRRVESAKKARMITGLAMTDLESILNPQPVAARVGAGFKTFAQADGNTRWVMLSSGAFEDRDGEIMSQAWLESAVAFAEKSGLRGTLNFWHKPHTDLGTCDFQALIGTPALLLESGVFYNTPAGRKAARYYQEHASEQGGSIEFLWTRRTSDGIYEPPGVIVRRSVLPKRYAAFPWASMSTKESMMAKQRNEIVAEFARLLEVSEEQAEEMLGHLEEGTKELKDYGVRWKETNADATAQANAPAADAAPTESAPENEAAPELAEKEAAPETAELESATAGEVAPQEATALEVVLDPAALELVVKQVTAAMQPAWAEVQTKIDTAMTRFAEIAQNMLALGEVATGAQVGVKELHSVVAKMQRADDEKIADAVKNLPRATVKSLTAQRPSQRTPDVGEKEAESLLATGLKTLYG